MDTSASSPVKPTESQKSPRVTYFIINIIVVIIIVVGVGYGLNKFRQNSIEEEKEETEITQGDDNVSHQTYKVIRRLFVVWLFIMIILYMITKITKARASKIY